MAFSLFRLKRLVFLPPLFCFFFSGCEKKASPALPVLLSKKETASFLKNHKKLATHLHPTLPPTFGKTAFAASHFDRALFENALFLKKNTKNGAKKAGSGITDGDLWQTNLLLAAWPEGSADWLAVHFDFYEVGRGQRISGYHTPVFWARKSREPNFSQPVFSRPEEGKMPSRSEIERGALIGKGLELGFLPNQKLLADAQMQGSFFLKFPNGKMEYLGFDGSNRAARDSASSGGGGRKEFNYVFFKKRKCEPLGSSGAALQAGVSLAFDPDFLPTGAAVLVEMPSPDGSKKHYRVMLVQDVGGGIQGTSKADFYCGIGDEAVDLACKINENGRIWLLFPRQLSFPQPVGKLGE